MSWKVLSAISIVFMATVVLAANPTGVSARTYSEIAGSPSCPSGTHLLNLEPPAAGTFTLSNGGRVVISNLTATSFDWAIHPDSIRQIDAGVVIVQGGPAAALYTYSPTPDTDDADTGLRAPLNPSTNQPYNITLIRLCFDPKWPTATPTSTLPATILSTATPTATPTVTATATPAATEITSTTSIQATPTPQGTPVVPLPPKTGNAGLLGGSGSGTVAAAALWLLITAVIAGRLVVGRQR